MGEYPFDEEMILYKNKNKNKDLIFPLDRNFTYTFTEQIKPK